MAPVSSYTDQQLLDFLKSDDRNAFGLLYRHFWQRLLDSAYKRTKDRELARDAVQNVFADLWNRRKRLEIVNLGAYLHRAVKFQVFKQISRQPKQAVFLDLFDEIVASPVASDDLILEKEIQEMLRLWLAALPEKRRQIYMMHYQEELSTQEIARRLGISQNTVQAQLYTASQSLRARLAQFLSIATIIMFIQR